MKLKMFNCQKKLTTMWFCYAGVILLLLVGQSIGNKFGDNNSVWEWFLGHTMPSLSLIAGAIVALALKADKDSILIDPFFYRLTWAISFLYLSLVLLTLVAENLTSMTAIELINQSSLWLMPTQSLVAIFLGIFFNRGEKPAP
ncbi:hypothetical protein [Paraglaciecola sp.]|uniref:hypothetical protein n=1 Tax=Paraglaciecola sp. TaxID=1920173 RepID=UPI003EF7F912